LVEYPRSQVMKVAAGSVIGTTIEWYDFFLYGYIAALVFPKIFFPPGYSQVAATILSLSTYAVGFVARPIGAMIFGHIGDRSGRRTGLLWDLVLMGIASLIIGLLPGYQVLGFGSLVIAALMRVLQGIGVGGEWGGATTWLTEYASQSKWRAFWGSWVQQGVPIGLLWASGMISIMSVNSDFFYSVGWRIPLFLGAIAAVAGIVIRLFLLESPLFERTKSEGKIEKMPSVKAWTRYWKLILLLAFSWAAQNASFYLYGTYAVDYQATLGMPKTLSSFAVTIASVISIFILIGFAILGDKIGRKQAMIIAFSWGLVFSFPYVLLIKQLDFGTTVLAQILMSIASIGSYSVLPAFFAESFPTQVRYSGAGLSYHMAAPFAGGLAPIITEALVGPNPSAYWYWFSTVFAVYFAISLVALMIVRDTKDKVME